MSLSSNQFGQILKTIAENAKTEREAFEKRCSQREDDAAKRHDAMMAESAKRHEEVLAANEARQVAMEVRHQAAETKNTADKKELVDKLAELSAAGNVGENNVILTHASKYERVLSEFRRSIKVKEFCPVQSSVNDWLKSVYDEVKIISLTKGIDMSQLTDPQWVFIVLSKLPSKIVQRLEAFCKREKVDFETVTYKRYEELFQ